jgi:predicted GIY-YIG superfamily endonuclease
MADYPQAYVAQGENGLLKVGVTSNFRRRIHTLRKKFAEKGDTLARYHACDRIEMATTVEWRLIHACRVRFVPHSGREWYVAGDFDAIVDIAIATTNEYRDRKPHRVYQPGQHPAQARKV